MKAIATVQNPDGTYDEVGMNNRRTTNAYQTERGLMRYGLKFCAGLWPHGARVRVEIFTGDRVPTNPETKPVKTVYVTVDRESAQVAVVGRVPVRFRVSTDEPERDVTAVFMSRETHPTNSPANRMCYARVGQHSECSLLWMDQRTRAATPEEYAPLLAELRQIYEADGQLALDVQP